MPIWSASWVLPAGFKGLVMPVTPCGFRCWACGVVGCSRLCAGNHAWLGCGWRLDGMFADWAVRAVLFYWRMVTGRGYGNTLDPSRKSVKKSQLCRINDKMQIISANDFKFKKQAWHCGWASLIFASFSRFLCSSSVERRTVNPYVTGSSPVRGANFSFETSLWVSGQLKNKNYFTRSLCKKVAGFLISVFRALIESHASVSKLPLPNRHHDSQVKNSVPWSTVQR